MTAALQAEQPQSRSFGTTPALPLRAQQGKLVILDEIHRAPGVFEILRGIIDDNRQAGVRHGQFLLLGASPTSTWRP